MKRTWWVVVVSGTLLALGFGYWGLQARNQVVLVQAKKGDITEAIYALGTVVARNSFTYKAAITKTIDKLYVVEGDQVQKGQKILEFDDRIAVRSPLNGTVTTLPYKTGENVFANQVVVTIQDLGEVFIEAQLDQLGALRVRKGLKVRVSFENLRQQVFYGVVDSLYPSAGNFVAHIEVNDLPSHILPGMTADLAIEVATKNDVILIPVQAMSNGQVVVQTGGHREKRPVQIGTMDSEWAEEISGAIKAGESLVIKRP